MVNPNDNDFTSEEPQLHPREEEPGSSARDQPRPATRKISTAMSHASHGTLEKAGRALERTEYFVRENPVPTILGALGLGIAIGLAIRYASESEQKPEIEVKSPLGNFKWTILSLPFVWRAFESARDKYERSADAVTDAMKDGVKRLKRIKVDRYAKPVRKRWRAWTR